MLSELYSDAILKAAAAIPPVRRLPSPDASAKKVSRVCGSEVEVDLKLDGDRVADFGMEARACALGQASASILAHGIVGASVPELLAVAREMRTMLKGGGPAPTGERWRDLGALAPIRYYPPRHASTLLVFEAVERALAAIAERDGAASRAMA